MSQNPIIFKAFEFVKDYLDTHSKAWHHYHNFNHTISVYNTVRLLGDLEQCSEVEVEILCIASLFHDVGICEKYEDHERISSQIAEDFLLKNNYSKDNINRVKQCILATKVGTTPQNLLEQIIKDADVNNIGNDSYKTVITLLRKELVEGEIESLTKLEWLEKGKEFASSHKFFTDSAKELFTPKKLDNIKWLDKQIAKTKRASEGLAKGNELDDKLAQTFYKTAMRNNTDLSALADGKANTMLSVSAVIITITIPMMIDALRKDMILVIPFTIFLLTCILAMIYATAATRPIKMMGMTSEEDIKAGKSDLFFFGNMFNMDFLSFKKGIKHVIKTPNYFDETAYLSLYFSSKALGGKFMKLRTCYTIFIIGICVSIFCYVAVFFFTFW